jgi:catechol 2,3-dioxygenase-like lactoylglutathione lyase family enzyme
MKILALDHIVIAVGDVPATCRFYERVLGMEPREDEPGKWSLHFGAQKISVQDVRTIPVIAASTTRGSGNFCLLTDTPIADFARHLAESGVEILAGPAQRLGAAGPILSVYFRDPDGNLIEVSNAL